MLLRTPRLGVSIRYAAALDTRDSVPLFTFHAPLGAAFKPPQGPLELREASAGYYNGALGEGGQVRLLA